METLPKVKFLSVFGYLILTWISKQSPNNAQIMSPRIWCVFSPETDTFYFPVEIRLHDDASVMAFAATGIAQQGLCQRLWREKATFTGNVFSFSTPSRGEGGWACTVVGAKSQRSVSLALPASDSLSTSLYLSLPLYLSLYNALAVYLCYLCGFYFRNETVQYSTICNLWKVTA